MNLPTAQTSSGLSTRIAPSLVPQQLHTIDCWQVIRHLDSGSTAHVWLMQHVNEHRFAACKTPKSASDIPLLSQEAELAQSLTHENLVKYLGPVDVVGADSTSGSATLWEFLPSGSLNKLIAAGGRLSLAEAVTVLLPMVQVTQYLHNHQIVHGDISPSNILFDLTGRPVLTDFGASRATALSSNVTGTPGFLAPEIEQYETRLTGLGSAADVYSLAAVGWFCLTGHVPGPTFSRVPLGTLNDGLAPDIVEVLEAGLSDEPMLRPNMEQLLNAVQYWAEPQPVDLFAAVDEYYELLLPTRKPVQTEPRPKGQNRRVSRSRAQSSGGGLSGHLKRRPGHNQRRLLLISGMLLCGGALATVTYAPNSLTHPSISVASPEALDQDFQAIVDSLAKARTSAWDAVDSSLVSNYAIEGSRVYTEDYETLKSLAAADNTLEGIRMRAIVESAEVTGHEAVLTVEWQTDRYTQHDSNGVEMEAFPSNIDQINVKLLKSEQGWKFQDF